MIEPFEQIFKTFGFFCLFVGMLIVVIVTLYKHSERQHEDNANRIKELEAARDKQATEERVLLLKALEDNTRAMRRISYYIKKFKNDSKK